MTLRISVAAGLAALTFMTSAPSVFAQSVGPTVRAEFTDSTAAGLAATKRVAITNVIVSFQASVGATHGDALSLSRSLMAMPEMDPALQDAITAEAYLQLKAHLTAAGYEVVSDAEVMADVNYREIIAKVGFVNHSRALNSLGDSILVSPPSLTPYMPYTMEGSPFESGVTSYLGWPSGWGKSATPGGFSLMKAATFYKLPGMEVALAKSLNAHVVKAFYVVSIGSTTMDVGHSSRGVTGNFGVRGTATTSTGTATANAQLSLLADQTRIAFRSPTGNAKWQKVNLNRPGPAKDGDVVVHLADTMLGGTDYFDVVNTENRGRGGGVFKFAYSAMLNNPAAYQRDVQAMIATSTRSMLGLVKR